MKTAPKPMVEKEVCGTCVYYRQHYVLTVEGRFQALWYGHCHNPRPRYPLPDDRCPRWEGGRWKETPDEDILPGQGE